MMSSDRECNGHATRSPGCWPPRHGCFAPDPGNSRSVASRRPPLAGFRGTLARLDAWMPPCPSVVPGFCRDPTRSPGTTFQLVADQGGMSGCPLQCCELRCNSLVAMAGSLSGRAPRLMVATNPAASCFVVRGFVGRGSLHRTKKRPLRCFSIKHPVTSVLFWKTFSARITRCQRISDVLMGQVTLAQA